MPRRPLMMIVKWLEKMRRWQWVHPWRSGQQPSRRVRAPQIQWEFPQEDEPWEPQLPVPKGNPREMATTTEGARRLQALVAAMIILATGLTFYLWRQAESGAQLREAVARAALVTQTARAGGPEPQAHIPATPMLGQTITYHGDIVSSFVYSSYTDFTGASYTMRQRTFYRESEDGWVRVEAEQAILGAQQQLETSFFTFIYYELDAASVQAVSAGLDAVYASIRYDYGLADDGADMTIHLSSDWPWETKECRSLKQMCFQSPALAQLPPELSESEALQLWLLTALVYRVRHEAIALGPIQYTWSYSAAALLHRQIRQHNAPLAAWHADFTAWLYSVHSRTPRPDVETLKQELIELCRRDEYIARQQFVFIGPCIAPALSDMQYLARFKAPDQLSQLYLLDADLMVTEMHWMRAIAFETVLDYVVVAYGRDSMPKLINGFRHHKAWKTLAPEVFGVSAEEFEAGWQEYLQQLAQQ
jgi:hypothetical protein